jgi:F-type H+-transporting ATPase subunit gamma
MPSTKEMKSRIKGVKSTGKITRAMEMISAVKMRKAVAQALAIRPYAESALSIFKQLSERLFDTAATGNGHASSLLAALPVRRELYVVVGSHRGLCGAFNAQIGRKLRAVLAEDSRSGREASFVAVGRKAEVITRRQIGTLLASFPEAILTPTIEQIRPIARLIQEEFLSGRIDRVVVVYTHFMSALRQEVKVRALLPVTLKDSEKTFEQKSEVKKNASSEYVIEPDARQVLDRLIPHLIETELLRAILESNASQEAARMVAMRNASDAAKEMVADLTLAYNQLRQAKVTQEIAELSAGMAAVGG